MDNEILKKLEDAKKSGSLSLYETKITDEIWQKIFKLKDLKFLELSNCNIDKLSEELSLPHIQHPYFIF